MNKTGKDLTKEAPRSPKQKIDGLIIIARTIDKCRAKLWGNIGEYHFDCPVDNMLFKFVGITGDDFKNYVEEGHTDEEIAAWVKSKGKKSAAEVAEWEKNALANDMSYDAGKKAWLEGENKRLGLDKDGTLFDMLEEDDRVSYKK